MRKNHLLSIIILLFILIAGGLCFSNIASKKIVISQEVWNSINLSDLSLHVDQLLKNGFDYDGFSAVVGVVPEQEADIYTYRRSSRLAAQLSLYPPVAEREDIDSQPTIHYRRNEYQGDNMLYILINDPSTGRLQIWVDYSENGKADSTLINAILLKLFTEYSFGNLV